MISIAMTTYNGEKFVLEQIKSILLQDYSDFELIICDDCSTDSTFEILQKMSLSDHRIKIFKNEQNLGFKKNFEKALSLCSGEFVALCDQDDIWMTNHLSLLVNNIGDYDLIAGNALLCDANCVSINTDLLSCSKFDHLPRTNEEWFFFLLHSNIFQGTATLFKKTLLTKALPIPENVKFHDYWLALIASSSNGVKYLKECILKYRQHGNNLTLNKKWKFFAKLKESFIKSISNDKMELQINTLTSLLPLLNSDIQKIQVANAIDYYSSQQHKIKHINKIKYFIQNYKLMYLSNNMKLFVLRLIKRILA